jgi:hypothetical protein
MAVKLFGFEIGKSESEEAKAERIPAFAPPEREDGALEIAPGGMYGTYVDLEGTAKTEAELVHRYRDMSMQPECDQAIDDIVNEAITYSEDEPAVQIVLDKTGLSENVQKKIRIEFEYVQQLLEFNNEAYQIFRRFYVDGRLYYHLMIDESAPEKGIQELRYIDPRKIRKVREKSKKYSPSQDSRMAGQNGLFQNMGGPFNEYFLYSPRGLTTSNQGIKIAKDAICHVTSGITDQKGKLVLSHLHKAVKPLNQLRMLEDATVIYRLARAPERRIFYIDVGNLPKQKAEQYLRDMMVKHKNRLVYDASTGEVRDDRKFMTMLEDFWLPRREGGRGTEITTLPGGQNLGEMDDVEYFKKKLYKSLHVPVTRMESENQFNLGRATEISRDEVKFAKFVSRLRLRFYSLFQDLVYTQCVLKGILKPSEWDQIKDQINYDYLHDNYFSELKFTEVLENRIRILNELDPFVGKYYSTSYVRKEILRQSEKEIEQMDAEIAANQEDVPDEEDQEADQYAQPEQQ